jgi:hypothetical protein
LYFPITITFGFFLIWRVLEGNHKVHGENMALFSLFLFIVTRIVAFEKENNNPQK